LCSVYSGSLTADFLFFTIRSTVTVFQPYHVVKLRSGYFQNVTILHADHPMLHTGNNMKAISGIKVKRAPLAFELYLHL
jgi:hypothetical protein